MFIRNVIKYQLTYFKRPSYSYDEITFFFLAITNESFCLRITSSAPKKADDFLLLIDQNWLILIFLTWIQSDID